MRSPVDKAWLICSSRLLTQQVEHHDRAAGVLGQEALEVLAGRVDHGASRAGGSGSVGA